MDELDELDDAIIEDTVHCTVCGADWVLGGDEEYMILDPPGDLMEAYHRCCEQVKLCPKCVSKIRSDLFLVTASQVSELASERDRLRQHV